MNKTWKYILFYVIQWTWGIILNIMGAFAALGLLITGHKPHWCGPYVYFITKWEFGGLELGMFFVIGNHCDTSGPHEMGHGIQNLWWGPLMLFVICIPSAVRYWYRELKYYHKGKRPPTAYDDIWFEGQATALGTKYFGAKWWDHVRKRDNKI